MKGLLAALVLAGGSVYAQTITTQTFGSGANQFSIEFVTIGNPGNAADTTGSPNPVGSVAYSYNLGKYEVSRDIVAKANTEGSLGITLQDMGSYGGNGVNLPATGLSWYEAATFVNWLNTSSGNTAAYKFVGGIFTMWSGGDAGYNANNMFRNSLAKYVIASADEWYKGAYGKEDGSWSNFPNGSDIAPTPVAAGAEPNTAVWNRQSGPADINNAGGLSSFGTMGQGGNVWEWMETAFDGNNSSAGENREVRGGAWDDFFSNSMAASARSGNGNPSIEQPFGFRVAMVPEPSSLVLLVAGGAVLMAGRRRK